MRYQKILGIDPGTNILGYAVIELSGESTTGSSGNRDSDVRILDLGVIKLDQKLDHQTKLKEIFLQLQEIIETYLPGEMAIEAPFYGKNVQSMLKLGRAQGVAMAAGMTMGLKLAEYSPKKVKQSVTGNGNAAKEQVSAMLSHLLGRDFSNEKLDATDALAVAYCHYLQLTGALPASGKKHGGWAKFVKENPGRLR